jgi:hypothetical protein
MAFVNTLRLGSIAMPVYMDHLIEIYPQSDSYIKFVLNECCTYVPIRYWDTYKAYDDIHAIFPGYLNDGLIENTSNHYPNWLYEKFAITPKGYHVFVKSIPLEKLFKRHRDEYLGKL